MRTYAHTLGGGEVKIYFPERRAEIGGFEAFLAQGDKILGLDTETTGLDIFSPGYACRLVQFGNDREAWVLRVDLFRDIIIKALRSPRMFTVHNAPFDLLVIDQTLGVRVEELADRVLDTRILAHLLDPRQPHEGGLGLALKPLAAALIDPDAPDTQAGLNAVFRSLGLTKSTGWAGIPIDHPTYVTYAGLDPILTWRLFQILGPRVKERHLGGLSTFEHHLQALVALMQRRGVLVDVPYTEGLVQDLLGESEEHRARAARYGVANVNSTKQVAEGLEAMGETLTETTPSGLTKVDRAVLLPLADVNRDFERVNTRDPNPLADAVLHAKRAEKWAASYGQAFLDLRDGGDRLHASLGTLQARTARMSVSRPPLQQLPAGDWQIRRALIADPGMSIVAADYAQVEIRVLAALSQDKTLVAAILDGEDLHDHTAALVFGEDFTPRQRAMAKNIGFGKVYGGGAATIARQTGTSVEDVRPALANYDRVYPGIKRYGRRLQDRAEHGKKEVITPSGRHLPLDRDRLYAATNYVVQSTARDLLAQAIVDLHGAGLGEHLLLPVHDEMIAQAPHKQAAEVAEEIGRVMSGTFRGIPILAEGEVYGPSWGHGYGAPATTSPKEGNDV